MNVCGGPDLPRHLARREIIRLRGCEGRVEFEVGIVTPVVKRVIGVHDGYTPLIGSKHLSDEVEIVWEGKEPVGGRGRGVRTHV